MKPPSGVEQRKFERQSVDREVVVEIGGVRLHGNLVDVSDGGAFIKMAIEVAVGDEVQLALADQTHSVETQAAVRRIDRGGFAIRFSPEESEKIAALRRLAMK